jgi:hypothetical protein
MMVYVMLISISSVARTKVLDDDGRDSRGVVLDTACRDDLRQSLLTPPSTTMSEPVMNEALVRGEEEGRVGELFGMQLRKWFPGRIAPQCHCPAPRYAPLE